MLLKMGKQSQFWLLLSVLLQLRDISGTPYNTPGEDIIQCVNEEEFEEMKGTLENNSQVLANIQNQFAHFQDQLTSLQSQLAEHMSTPPWFPNGSFLNPAPSCKYVEQGSPSGWYWIQSIVAGNARLEYCNMARQCCGSRGGWMRVAHLDMTDPNQQCPGEFRLISRSNKRVCGRNLRRGGCNSATFAMHGVSYTKVCGKIKAYHYGTPSGFNTGAYNTINDPYLEGVSLTHGRNPRKHIWSFANALQEDGRSYEAHICPCTSPRSTQQRYIPNFVGSDYFCDTGVPYTPAQGVLYTDDPLWDGQGCGLQSTCCTFNTPPWSCKTLPQPTTEDIEVRICANQDGFWDEDSPIELIDIYVQ